jgi:FAD/FMN-containing dehydrogenase
MLASWVKETPLVIHGGGSKTFYGSADEGEVLSTRKLTGVVDYQPKELVLTARAGTPLAEIETLLTGQNQMLAFGRRTSVARPRWAAASPPACRPRRLCCAARDRSRRAR